MVPMNLMTKSGKADFVITGQWATKAYKEAARYGEANVVASSKDQTFCYIPKLDPSTFTKDADYFHICMNKMCIRDRLNIEGIARGQRALEKIQGLSGFLCANRNFDVCSGYG